MNKYTRTCMYNFTCLFSIRYLQ